MVWRLIRHAPNQHPLWLIKWLVGDRNNLLTGRRALLKFLIIDDHADYRRLLSHHIAARWPDAIIREFDPVISGRLPAAFSGAGNDVVLLGHPCGQGDVLDWVRQFRSLPRFPPLVVIGNGDERQIVAAIKAGADEYVGKPGLSNARLVSAIEDALEARKETAAGGSADSRAGKDPSVSSSQNPVPRNYEVVRTLSHGEIATVYLARKETPTGNWYSRFCTRSRIQSAVRCSTDF
ncbi:MAG: hypothetical protein R3F24_12210 [Gammaproteobacteria bacterium]